MMIEEVTGFELERTVDKLTFMGPHHLRDQNPGIVVADAMGNASEEVECPDVAFPIGLRAFSLEYGDKKGVRLQQRHHKKEHLP
jgi:hypothetical protein